MFNGLVIAMQLAASNSSSSQGLSFAIQNFNKGIENLGNNIPTLFTTAGLALLGLLIPLTIAILQDHFQKRLEVKDENSVLDANVILDKVFRFKPLIVFIGLVFIPFIFWDIQVGYIRLIEISFAIIGIFLILGILLRVYDWTKGNVASYRKEYLKSQHVNRTFTITWKSIWKNKMTLQDEKVYFDIFSEKVDRLMKIR
jgi:hypothetical protein